MLSNIISAAFRCHSTDYHSQKNGEIKMSERNGLRGTLRPDGSVKSLQWDHTGRMKVY
jgi:hypothetical protein